MQEIKPVSPRRAAMSSAGQLSQPGEQQCPPHTGPLRVAGGSRPEVHPAVSGSTAGVVVPGGSEMLRRSAGPAALLGTGGVRAAQWPGHGGREQDGSWDTLGSPGLISRQLQTAQERCTQCFLEPFMAVTLGSVVLGQGLPLRMVKALTYFPFHKTNPNIRC